MTSSKLILCGPGGSGKTTLAERLARRGKRVSVSWTTRPRREGEPETAYTFTDDDTFARMQLNNRFLETAEFNGWKYGTPASNWDYFDVFILTPTGVRQLTPEMRAECFILYLNPARETLRTRLALRAGDADSVERRMAADAEDFHNFFDYDTEVWGWANSIL